MSLQDLINSLGVSASGLPGGKKPHSDESAVPGARVKSLGETFDRGKLPVGRVGEKLSAAARLSKDDPERAFCLLKSAAAFAPDAPGIYLMLAGIAAENKAWGMAGKACETAKWLISASGVSDSAQTEEIELLSERIREGLAEGTGSGRQESFWATKAPDRFWILERIYYRGQERKLVDLCFKLLDISPYDPENYYAAYKALSLLGSSVQFERYAERVSSNLKDDPVEKNIFLGLAKLRTSYLAGAVGCFGSALKAAPQNLKALQGAALGSLLMGDIGAFLKTGEKIVACPPVRDASYAAIGFILSCLAENSLPVIELPEHADIARKVAEIIYRLLESGQAEIASKLEKNFARLGYFRNLPLLPICLAEIYVGRGECERALLVLQGSSDSEVHRIRARILRLERKREPAESELIEYRRKISPVRSQEFTCRVLNLKMEALVAPNSELDVLRRITDLYHQTEALINSAELEYGVSGLTCKTLGCQDCCNRTFPVVSFSEYVNIRRGLLEHTGEFRAGVEQESRSIVDLYVREYGQAPPFLFEYAAVKESYPIGLSFRCPFLGDNSCEVYAVRPFGCRCYGYSTYNGLTMNACDYFYRQFEVASAMDPVRKVIGATSFYKNVSECDKVLIGRIALAPLPVWFAQNHEQTLKKLSL